MSLAAGVGVGPGVVTGGRLPLAQFTSHSQTITMIASCPLYHVVDYFADQSDETSRAAGRECCRSDPASRIRSPFQVITVRPAASMTCTCQVGSAAGPLGGGVGVRGPGTDPGSWFRRDGGRREPRGPAADRPSFCPSASDPPSFWLSGSDRLSSCRSASDRPASGWPGAPGSDSGAVSRVTRIVVPPSAFRRARRVSLNETESHAANISLRSGTHACTTWSAASLSPMLPRTSSYFGAAARADGTAPNHGSSSVPSVSPAADCSPVGRNEVSRLNRPAWNRTGP